MDWLAQLFLHPLSETFFQKSLLGAGMVAVVCGVVGCLVVLRRMAFLGDALSHAMIAGVAGGYLFMKVIFGIEAHAPAMLLGSVIAAVITVMLIGFVARVSRVKEDASIGIMYTGIFAGGVVLVSIFRNYIHIDLMHFIMGDVLAVADADLWVAAVISALVLTVLILFFRQFQLTSFDPVMAASIGMPVVLIEYALTTCVSLVVVSAVAMVGVILVVGLLITPAATAYLLSDRLDRMMILAALFGLTSVIGGLYLCIWLDSSGGGAIMLFCTLQFLVVLIVAPKYGLLARWLRLRRMVPQQVVEDILVTLIRRPEAVSPLAELEANLPMAVRTTKAIKNLSIQGLLELRDSTAALTEAGKAEANRILRAHRLWETYLDHLGAPVEDIHSTAHHLEHIHDPGAVAYLDDLLVHPVQDPHGKEIPEDPIIEGGSRLIPLSYLRPGQEGQVESVGKAAAGLGLEPGDRFRLTARLDQGRTWQISGPGGKKIALDHSAADEVMVSKI